MDFGGLAIGFQGGDALAEGFRASDLCSAMLLA